MECMEHCLIGLNPPSLPPPPPIPNFISYLNLTIDCDLCSWAGVNVGESVDGSAIQLSSLLIIVGLVSACFGAGIMAAILSIKRIRAFASSTSIRHLARKCEESNATTSNSVEGFSASGFSENTYCDGPYNNTNDKDLSNNCCNIYAELHPPITSSTNLWNRPPISPPIENCYLELTDLPVTTNPPPPPRIRQWFIEESPNTSTYYSDLDNSSINHQHIIHPCTFHRRPE